MFSTKIHFIHRICVCVHIYTQYLFTVKVTVSSNNKIYMKAVSENHLHRNIMLNTFHLQYIYIYYFEAGLTVSNVIQHHYSTSFYSKYMNSFIRNHFGVHM